MFTLIPRRLRVSSCVEHVKPYVPPDSLAKILASDKKFFKLDYNEATIPPSPQVTSAIVNFCEGRSLSGKMSLTWYPRLSSKLLLNELSKYLHVEDFNLLAGNGSDDVLKLICETYLERGDRVLVPQPSYPQVEIFIQSRLAELVKMEMPSPFENSFQALVEEIEKHNPKLVYLVTPNNPTGTEWTNSEIEKLLLKYPSTIFVVDEAYIEFSSQASAKYLIGHKNIILTRTFSKCWALGGLRLGYMITHESTRNQVFRVYNTKSVNELAQIAGVAALQDKDYYLTYAREVCEVRDEFVKKCTDFGIEARAGGGNFLCVKIEGKDPKLVVDEMFHRGIVIRDIHARFPGWIRITCGDRQTMDEVFTSLREILD